MTESEIIKVFKPYGEIISVKIKTKGETSRFNNAYVLFEKVESCQNAIRNLDQTRPFGNTPIDVEYWISKVDLAAEKEQNCKD